MERVGWGQRCIRIETEDLVEQNGFYTNMPVAAFLAYLDIRLIPGKAKAALENALEVWIGRFIREEGTALYGEEVEGKTGLESLQIHKESLVEPASDALFSN